jgi:hypothetical protein
MQGTAHHQTCDPRGGQETINTMNQAILNNQKNLTRQSIQ